MTTQNQSEFQNEHLQVSLKKEQGCKVHLDVKISPEATKACYQKAMAIVRKEVSLPGFRKGKAPEAMIHQKFESHIEKEWKDTLLNMGLDEAIKLVKIVPFNRNSVKSASLKSVSKEKGAEASYSYESFPDIPTISPETLSIPLVKISSVTEKEINETIEELSLQQAEWSDVEDREAKEDDFVSIDVVNIDETPNHIICNDTLFPLKKGKMGDWMFKLILGMTPGQSVEGMTEKDAKDEEDCASCEDGSHQHPDFIPIRCRITLNSIREAKPHALDDDFAKKFGASTFKELSEKVKISLEKKAENEQRNKQRQLIEKELFARYPFDVPASILQDEMKVFKEQMVSELRAEGMEESKIPLETKKYEIGALDKFTRDYKLYFITQRFAKEHHIEVTPDEITMEMLQQMMARGEQYGKETQNQIHLQLLTTKALDRMIEMSEKR